MTQKAWVAERMADGFLRAGLLEEAEQELAQIGKEVTSAGMITCATALLKRGKLQEGCALFARVGQPPPINLLIGYRDELIVEGRTAELESEFSNAGVAMPLDRLR